LRGFGYPRPPMLEHRKLSGNAVKSFQSALRSAFPDKNALARMVLEGLEQNLDDISTADSLTGIVFALVKWAESQGRISDLVKGALTANPGNPELQAFADAYAAAPLPAPTAPSTDQPSGGSPTGPLQGTINLGETRNSVQRFAEPPPQPPPATIASIEDGV